MGRYSITPTLNAARSTLGDHLVDHQLRYSKGGYPYITFRIPHLSEYPLSLSHRQMIKAIPGKREGRDESIVIFMKGSDRWGDQIKHPFPTLDAALTFLRLDELPQPAQDRSHLTAHERVEPVMSPEVEQSYLNMMR